ncbi:MAG TPA: glycosyltransferase [Terriglobales bacterium]|nr:glycosyltransferase [Terriglobales bacterium]
MIAWPAVLPDEPLSCTKSLHVLTLTPFYPVRGDDAQGCFVAEPLPWLERLGMKNTVIAVRPFYHGRAVVGDSAVPSRWVSFFSLPSGWGLPSTGRFLFARIFSEIERLHRRQPIDLIHAHSALPCGHAAYLLSRELGIPFVVSVHGLDAYFSRQVGGLSGAWCGRVASLVYREAKDVICVSEKIRDQVMSRLGNVTHTNVIYNGVDPDIFFPANGDSETILSVGSLIETKGHEQLLRALASVHKAHPAVNCDIVGEGPEQKRLQKLSAELGLANRVRFLGRLSRSQVAEAMRRCKLFALPSRYEGLGCVYVEAMCSGKVAIGCRGQGIEEVIQHGVNGWLVSPRDVQELANALSFLLQQDNLRRRMGEAARQTILQHYTLEHQGALLSDLYRRSVS